MPWQTPKTNWAVGDGVSNSDFNRIEGNIGYLKDSPDLNAPTVTTQAYGNSSTKAANTAFATGQDLGVGQSWQDVKASRASGQTYTNTTGKPIQLYVTTSYSATVGLELRINEILISDEQVGSSQSTTFSCSAIIPNGATYRLDFVNSTIATWFELR